MILLAEHDKPTTLAAKKKRQPGASSWPTSTPKNRVWSFENTPSGRPSVEPQLSWETATGSVQYTYQIASGRAEWLSRDPAGEDDGSNIYEYVHDDPIGGIDPLGNITLSEAKAHWQSGTGTSMSMNFSAIDTSDVHVKDFPQPAQLIASCSQGSHAIDSRDPYTTHGQIWYVLGTITLRLQGTLNIDCKCHWTFSGNLKSFDDYYDFDMKPWKGHVMRNLATMAGSLYNGSGKGFYIDINGSKSINESGGQ